MDKERLISQQDESDIDNLICMFMTELIILLINKRMYDSYDTEIINFLRIKKARFIKQCKIGTGDTIYYRVDEILQFRKFSIMFKVDEKEKNIYVYSYDEKLNLLKSMVCIYLNIIVTKYKFILQ